MRVEMRKSLEDAFTKAKGAFDEAISEKKEPERIKILSDVLIDIYTTLWQK